MHEKTKSKFSIFKKISLAISAILIITSFICFWQAKKLAKPFRELEAANPIRMKVDVSKQGVYSCNIEHSQYAELVEHGADLLLNHKSDLTFPEIFKQLKGRVEIFDDSGKLIVQFNLHDEPHAYQLKTEDIKGYPPMWVIYPFTPECHQLKLTITKPVEELANVEQALEGYYLLCGMEFLESGLAGFTGLILLGIGLLIAVIMFLLEYRKRHKIKLQSTEQSPSGFE